MISFSPSPKFDKELSLVLIDEKSLNTIRSKIKSVGVSQEIEKIIKSKQFQANPGEIFPIVNKGKMILLVGLGKKLGQSSVRIFARKALLSSYCKKSSQVEIFSCLKDDNVFISIIEAILIGGYTFDKYLTKKEKNNILSKRYVIVSEKKKVYEDTIQVCQGVNLTRDLVNDNADTVNSKYIENKVKAITKGKPKVKLEILGRAAMKKKGLGLHLAVNKGSLNEPKLIIVKYNGGGTKDKYTAVIGKGITFDTGGLNLKPTGNIETMRMDMSGTAAVIGTLQNVLKLKIKKNIIFVCAVAENVTGSGSYKPGDIIRGYSGKTVEVANTDAEGRLVLADAISYIVKNYKPNKIIDIATLTGACIVALGLDHTGLVSNDDKFADALIESAQKTDDRVWRLPVYPELKDSVKSRFADIRNLGLPKGAGGTITAAEFLRQFTDDTKWAHLDIAGTAYVDNNERLYFGHGATGSGVRLLTHYLKNN